MTIPYYMDIMGWFNHQPGNHTNDSKPNLWIASFGDPAGPGRSPFHCYLTAGCGVFVEGKVVCFFRFRVWEGWKRHLLWLEIHGLGGGNSNIFISFYVHPYLGKMNPFWRAYLWNRLVQPPTSGVVYMPCASWYGFFLLDEIFYKVLLKETYRNPGCFERHNVFLT